MKLILPKLTAAAMVATATSVNALQWPSLASLRGSDNYAEVQDDCTYYYNQGKNDVNHMWRNKPFYSNCDNVWQLEDAADDLKADRYPTSSNWRTDANNQCARNGVDDQVDSIEKSCLWDDSSQCTDLGNAAAEQIVMREWCSPGYSSSASASDTPNYKAECRDAAVDICKGNISNVANRWCPSKTLPMSDLNAMKSDCLDQVNSMVGMDNSDNEREPSNPINECGTKGCGSCKKAYCPNTNERKQCKARLCSVEELAVFFPEDVESEATVMESQ